MERFESFEGGVCSAKGFRAAGVAAGIKYKDRKDVALIVADAPCSAAAMFTTNAVAAAPVVFDRSIAKYGCAQAILANSGCANACTGQEGLKDTEKSAAATAAALGIDKALVMVASTGVIGRRLPMNRLLAGIKSASQQLDDSLEAGLAANMATLTTDTRPKQAAVRFSLDGKTVTVGGMIKGSGMIAPNMATMLGFITTDAAIAPSMLRRALAKAVSVSFNRLVVDGDMSTNDSVFVMASGKAGNAKITKADERYENFAKALTRVCIMLTKQIEKKIDVLQANYFTDDQIFILEACLLKVSTNMMLNNKDVGRIVRIHGARIVEVNPTYSIIEKKGITADILSLFHQLDKLGVVLQFVRSGRIAVTKSCIEQLDKYLEEREAQR